MRAWRSDVLNEVLIVEPDVFGDPRGYFLETFPLNAYHFYPNQLKAVLGKI